jgi:hypothetical protein
MINNAIRLFGVLLMSASLVIVLNSDLRGSVRSYFKPQYRVVLAVAMADLEGHGVRSQILKIKTNDGLFLEVYSPRAHGEFGIQQELVASTQLPDKKDGYFTFNEQVTNLAIDVLGREKAPTILASSFDGDLVGHLNVYRYVSGQRELERIKLD